MHYNFSSIVLFPNVINIFSHRPTRIKAEQRSYYGLRNLLSLKNLTHAHYHIFSYQKYATLLCPDTIYYKYPWGSIITSFIPTDAHILSILPTLLLSPYHSYSFVYPSSLLPCPHYFFKALSRSIVNLIFHNVIRFSSSNPQTCIRVIAWMFAYVIILVLCHFSFMYIMYINLIIIYSQSTIFSVHSIFLKIAKNSRTAICIV